MMKHTIQFPFSGRYFSIGQKKTARQIWFVLHGYGQLAEYFIRKFDVLEDQKIFVVAPEGLSRFYLEDIESRTRTGNTRVGASWMTREDRLSDIKNYICFLDEIYRKEADVSLPVTVLGFSQGAATASRWITEGTIEFNRLILWGGILPPDLDFAAGKEILKTRETILVKGKEDPFMQHDRFSEMKGLADKLDIEPRVIEYSGNHDIDRDTLIQLV